jgi:hypothetical protein
LHSYRTSNGISRSVHSNGGERLTTLHRFRDTEAMD